MDRIPGVHFEGRLRWQASIGNLRLDAPEFGVANRNFEHDHFTPLELACLLSDVVSLDDL